MVFFNVSIELILTDLAIRTLLHQQFQKDFSILLQIIDNGLCAMQG